MQHLATISARSVRDPSLRCEFSNAETLRARAHANASLATRHARDNHSVRKTIKKQADFFEFCDLARFVANFVG